MDVFGDACAVGFGRCDPRVTNSTEDQGILERQEVRHPIHQGEIVCLYDDVRPSLYAYLSTLGLVAAEADDVVQEGFFRLVRDLSTGNEVKNLRGWLFRVAHNLAMDVYRGIERDGVADSESLAAILKEQVDPDPDPEEAYSQQEKISRVHTAIQNLTSQQRDCLLLRAEGKSYHDIGLTLGVSTQRAGFLVQRSLVRLLTFASDGVQDELRITSVRRPCDVAGC